MMYNLYDTELLILMDSFTKIFRVFLLDIVAEKFEFDCKLIRFQVLSHCTVVTTPYTI